MILSQVSDELLPEDHVFPSYCIIITGGVGRVPDRRRWLACSRAAVVVGVVLPFSVALCKNRQGGDSYGDSNGDDIYYEASIGVGSGCLGRTVLRCDRFACPCHLFATNPGQCSVLEDVAVVRGGTLGELAGWVCGPLLYSSVIGLGGRGGRRRVWCVSTPG